MPFFVLPASISYTFFRFSPNGSLAQNSSRYFIFESPTQAFHEKSMQ